MATPATSNRAESTDTARLAHGRVRKKSRRKVPPPRVEGGGVWVSAMPGPEYRHVSAVQAALGDCFQAVLSVRRASSPRRAYRLRRWLRRPWARWWAPGTSRSPGHGCLAALVVTNASQEGVS